jgi:hypothetical protein
METGNKQHEQAGYDLPGTAKTLAGRWRRLVPAVLLLLSVAASASAAQVGWTGGAGDGKWESGGNWSGGEVPGADDDVTIPPDSGTITTNGGTKEVKSLDVEDSESGGTKIQPDGPGKSLKIKTSGDVHIGEGNTARGSNGNNGQTGGNVEIESTDGKVTNDGTLEGGDGGTGTDPKDGGDVKVTGDDVENNGTETGGKGGSYTGTGRGKGKDGGDVDNKADHTCKPGKKKGGDAGTGKPNGNDGSKGKVDSSGEEFVSFIPGDRQEGATIAISTGPGGMIQLIGLQHGAFLADQSIFINAGGPGNPIEMFNFEPGAVVFQAGEQICLHGEVIMDGDRSLEEISEPDAIISPEPCLPPPGPFLDEFDDYDLGDVCGQSGWEEWEGSSDVCGQVTDAEQWSGSQSLLIEGASGPAGDDTVHRFDVEGGVVRFQTQILVPEDASGEGHVILLNQYPARQTNNWSLQITLDADSDLVFNRNAPSQSAELRRGEWANLVALIDLDADLVQVFYAGEQFVFDRSWRNGVDEGGQPWLKALDLYAGEPNGNGITAAYFDDVQVEPMGPNFGACCMESEGVCVEAIHMWDCEQMGGSFFEAHGCGDFDPPCGDLGGCLRNPAWVCDGDTDGDGQVNPVDSGLVQAAFGSLDEQDVCNYDVDCDGQINPVDSGIVQSLFGTCEPPRDVCR